MQFRPSRMAAIIAGTMLLSQAAWAETLHLKTALDGKAEVPAVAGSGTAEAMFVIDSTAKTLHYTVTYSGLSGPVTAAHIHGPAEAGTNAGVMVPLAAGPSPLKGEATLSDAHLADILAGKTYVNLHTAAHPGGEIRGQITR